MRKKYVIGSLSIVLLACAYYVAWVASVSDGPARLGWFAFSVVIGTVAAAFVVWSDSMRR